MNNQSISPANCIIIGQRELKNWPAYGVLRLSRHRICYFDGTQESFSDMMNSVNDFDNEIGMEYFFVVLKDLYQTHIEKKLDSEHFYLSFKAVCGIYTLDDVAYQRMQTTANMAKIHLYQDEHLNQFAQIWKARHNDYINDIKAERLVSLVQDIECLQQDDKGDNPFEVYLSKVDLSSKNILDKKSKIAYAWAISNSYISHHLNKKTELSDLYKMENKRILSYYNEISTHDISPQTPLSLSSYPVFLDERKQVQQILQKDSESAMHNALLFTLYVHYKMLIQDYFDQLADQIFLALAKDISHIKHRCDKKEVAKLVYWLGCLLPEVFVNSLHYARNSSDFAVVNADLLLGLQELLNQFDSIMTQAEQDTQANLSDNHQAPEMTAQNTQNPAATTTDTTHIATVVSTTIPSEQQTPQTPQAPQSPSSNPTPQTLPSDDVVSGSQVLTSPKNHSPSLAHYEQPSFLPPDDTNGQSVNEQDSCSYNSSNDPYLEHVERYINTPGLSTIESMNSKMKNDGYTNFEFLTWYNSTQPAKPIDGRRKKIDNDIKDHINLLKRRKGK